MTGQPALDIIRNGERLTEDARVRLTLLRVVQSAGSPAQAELSWTLEGVVPVIETNDSITVNLDGQPLFDGQIRARELERSSDGALTLRVRAYDALDKLRQHSQLQTRETESLDAFVRAVTAEAGCAVEGFDPVTPNAYMFGRGRTALAQLRSVTSQLGYYFYLDGKILRGFSLTPEPAAPRTALAEDHLVGQSDSRARVPEIHWRQLVEARLASTAVGTAARVRVLGSHPSASEHFDTETGAGEALLVVPGQVFGSSEHAQRRATALSTQAQAASKHFQGLLLPGNSSLRPGQTLAVSGVPGERAALHLVLTRVTHSIDAARGYATELCTQPPAIAEERSGAALVAIGRVVELNDDGRVRVFFPDYQERSDWLRVVSPGAGKERGFVMLPDVDDHVVVLSPDADPAHGVVIGGVWPESPRDAGVSDGRRRRGEWGNAQQRVSFDEDDASLTVCSGRGATLRLDERDITLRSDRGRVHISDGRGSGVEFDGGQVRLYSSRPLTIESPGQPLRIRAARIDFEEA
jgi:phage baseplate assembly protein gpV